MTIKTKKNIKGNRKQKSRYLKHKLKKKQLSFHKLNCSPENKETNYTCYSEQDLIKLKNMWNARHSDKPITTNNSKDIWNLLKQYYSTICNKESCWIKQMTKDTKMEQELLNAFSPKSPNKWKKNPNEWLSSIDILKVMNQYEKKYKCFNFLGPSPIDYDTHMVDGSCVWDELCNFSLQKHITIGKTKVGIIFNLDTHTMNGSHWVSVFINITKNTIFYFDSVGTECPKQIRKFINAVIKQGHMLPNRIDFKFDQNYPIEHQYGNTECGMYSLFFIVHMLKDKINSHYLKTHILKDTYIEKFRKIFFNEDL
jgi:hypothetical protein